MRINTNITALSTLMSFGRADKKINTSSLRMSSGSKINSSKEDAAGMAIGNSMRNRIGRINMASRNSMDGISLIQTAEGALNEVTNILQRMRELAVQSANEVLVPEDREKIQYEIDSLKEEIDSLSARTDFNGIKLLNGSAARLTFGNDDNVARISYVSDDMEPGNLRYDIFGAGVPAKVTAFYPLGTGVAGFLSINNYDVEITEADTSDIILNKIVEAGNQSGIDVLVEEPKISLITKESGKAQEIRIKMSNPELANSLGLTEGVVHGIDAKIENVIYYDKDGNKDASFNNTTVVLADGNRVNISSDEGRKVAIDLQLVVSNSGDFFLNDGREVSDAGVIRGAVPMGGSVKDFGPIILQVGADTGMDVSVVIPEVTSKSLGIEDLNYLSTSGAGHAIETVDKALNDISNIRANLGAYQNRLEYTGTSLDISSENMQIALSRIMDTNMATEMTAYTQQSVISQAAMSILSQANQRPQEILQLL